jgi:NCAIR mutase (PurE)-related protein
MNQQFLANLLENVKNGTTSIEDALTALRKFPYENVNDVVRLDHQRAIRCGFPEMIFGAGKSEEQLISIITQVLSQKNDLLITRVEAELAQNIIEKFPALTYHARSKVLTWRSDSKKPIGNVLVLSAGTADIPVAEEAVLTAQMMGAQVTPVYDVGVAGLHRLLDKIDLLQAANVLVVVAGMEGALPSVVAGLVSAPVIAVPTSIGYGASFNGLAALLAMLNSCANGVSVVNIDNGFGAGYQAALINQKCYADNL